MKKRKYTMHVRTNKCRTEKGELRNMWAWHYVHVEAATEEEAAHIAVGHVDPELEPAEAIEVK